MNYKYTDIICQTRKNHELDKKFEHLTKKREKYIRCEVTGSFHVPNYLQLSAEFFYEVILWHIKKKGGLKKQRGK